MLADVDDRTLDGNTRMRADGSVVNTVTRMGDTLVDIKDFRVLRDLMLSLSGQGAALDGPGSLMLDANLNSQVLEGEMENIWPTLDLNGSAMLDNVPAVVRRFGQDLTDLDVFKLVYADADVPVDELDTLLTSGDVHLDATPCFEADPTIATLEAGIYFPGGNDVYRTLRLINPAAPQQIETVASGTAWEAWLFVTHDDGANEWRLVSTFSVLPGEDLHISTCGDVGVLACTNIDDSAGFFDNTCDSNEPTGTQNGARVADAARSSANSTREAHVEINDRGVCVRADLTVRLPAIRALAMASVVVTPQAFMEPPTAFQLSTVLGFTGLLSEAEVYVEAIAGDGSTLGTIQVYYSADNPNPVWRVRNNPLWAVPLDGSFAGEFDLALSLEEVVLLNVWAMGSNFNERQEGSVATSVTLEYPFGACIPPEP